MINDVLSVVGIVFYLGVIMFLLWYTKWLHF